MAHKPRCIRLPQYGSFSERSALRALGQLTGRALGLYATFRGKEAVPS